MARIKAIGQDVKSKRTRVQEMMERTPESIDVKLQLVQELIPLGLHYLNDVLQEEVNELAGLRYKHDRESSYNRWGKQWGSAYIGGQKVPIEYPRVRDTEANKEVELVSYRKAQEPAAVDEKLFRRVLHGLSCRRYRECCEMIPEVFGMSKTTVSRRFMRASEKRLREFCERKLDVYDIVSIIIDGKTFQDDGMIIAVGITIEGEKVMLGFIQSATENGLVCKEFLERLIERGLKIGDGILCVIDGSKGLRKGIEDACGEFVVVQRCQWHKRENVVKYLPEKKKAGMRKKLQRAYEEPTYDDAKRELIQIKQELVQMNKSAVESLEEGFEDTLTLHRLGLFDKLGISLKTTNCLESIMAQIGQRMDKVDCFRNSEQKQRWLASSLLDIEPRLRRIKGYKYLPLLREAIKNELGLNVKAKVA